MPDVAINIPRSHPAVSKITKVAHHTGDVILAPECLRLKYSRVSGAVGLSAFKNHKHGSQNTKTDKTEDNVGEDGVVHGTYR